jgi:putative endonuclease
VKHTQNLGNVGEYIAEKFLVKHGFTILARNYRMRIGEIDIIVKKDTMIHFVEVKSLRTPQSVSRETYRPEFNVSPSKLRKIGRVASFYLEKKKFSRETDWQIDVIAVWIDRKARNGRVYWYENMIF